VEAATRNEIRPRYIRGIEAAGLGPIAAAGESEGLLELIRQDQAVARELLKFRFDRQSTAAILRLLQKNNRGTITVQERVDLEKFMRVGQLFDLLHAKARVVLHAR
jgi:hypothetical protein